MTNVHIALQMATNEALELRDMHVPAAVAGDGVARGIVRRLNRILDMHDAIRAEWEAQTDKEQEQVKA